MKKFKSSTPRILIYSHNIRIFYTHVSHLIFLFTRRNKWQLKFLRLSHSIFISSFYFRHWSMEKIDNFIILFLPLFSRSLISHRQTKKKFSLSISEETGGNTQSQIINYQLLRSNNSVAPKKRTNTPVFFLFWQFSVIEFPPSRGPLFSVEKIVKWKNPRSTSTRVKKAVENFPITQFNHFFV